MSEPREPGSDSFGGWRSYQAWADHGFTERRPDPDRDRDDRAAGSRGDYRPAGPGEDTAEWLGADWTDPHGERPRHLTGSEDTGWYDTGQADPGWQGGGQYADTGGQYADPGWHGSEYGESDADTSSLVRPYARTGGRTRADRELAMETLVSVTDHGRSLAGRLSGDKAAICRLCVQPISVAEVGARLRVPLGVARILLSDLAAESVILVHDSAVHAGDGPSLDFMERVLVGLRNL